MTLEQLRIFVAVAEREHVTAAARALNLTQSAASSAIAALEERHGVRLFHRVGRGVALTEAGRAFLDEARAVLARAASAEAVLGDMAGLSRGTLRLIGSQTIAAYWLPPLLARYHALHPGITVELAIGNSQAAADRVEEGGADLGFAEGPVDRPALSVREVGRDRLVLVQTATAPLPATVDAAWLRGARWVSREAGSGTRASFDAALAARGVDPARLDIALTLPSNEGVRTAVAAGAGIAALSSLVVERGIEAGRLAELPFALGPRPFFKLRHKERYTSAAADALLALIDAVRTPQG
ncbi:MAG: LysR family transcriptional regulator [Sphingomonadales bacterium]|nr:LysR family transcriptional regulator [Sphingomonadales bacterium]MDE2569418.1 LysR family transcriptional regulator [Sphingomonadales bacterium]